MSGAATRYPAAVSAGTCRRQEKASSGKPWQSTTSGPSPSSSTCSSIPFTASRSTGTDGTIRLELLHRRERGGEQRVDRRVGIGEALILGGPKIQRDHRRAFARERELGVDEAHVGESQLLEGVNQPGLAVVPALAGGARSVAAAACGRERQGLLAQEAAVG